MHCRSQTAARKGPAFFSYSDNYLIDTDHGVILDVEGTRSIRQAEVGSTKTMLARVKDKFGLVPDWMIADTACGSGPMLGWLVDRKTDPYIPVIRCPAGHCAAMAREGTRPHAPTAPGHAQSSTGMQKMINTSAPKVMR